jgi:hypothetical protein
VSELEGWWVGGFEEGEQGGGELDELVRVLGVGG